MTPTELWLPIGAAAFYLYDSLRLLWQNELLYGLAGKRWYIAGGSNLRWQGRRVYCPNPLLPQRLEFPVRWSMEDPRGDAGISAATLQLLRRALRPLGFIALVQAWILLVILPLATWILGTGLTLLALFALFYLLTFIALALVFARRAVLALSTRRYWMLAFDCVACVPFCANLVRRLCALHGLPGNPVLFAAREFSADTQKSLLALLHARIDEEQTAREGTPRSEAAVARMLAPLQETGR